MKIGYEGINTIEIMVLQQQIPINRVRKNSDYSIIFGGELEDTVFVTDKI